METASTARSEATNATGEHPLGTNAAAILATEHWSLIATRSLIWNEAMSRATVFLTVLSASIIALALMADATGFGSHTTTVALVLLPVVLLLGIATYVRLVQINIEEFKLVLAMNRLRHGYLTIAPGLEPYFTTGDRDDEPSLVRTYMIEHPSQRRLWVYFLVNTPTIVATIDAALAAAIVVLVAQAVEASVPVMVFGAAVVFVAMWATLLIVQWRTMHPFPKTPRFPSAPDPG
ncbi:MAG: hypothetical protein ACRDWG_13315 [Actinomycetes bacterium]